MKREEMEAVITGGGSVLHEGRLITSLDKLPSKGALAKSETEKAAAAEDIDAQIAALENQRAALKAEEKSEGGEGDKTNAPNVNEEAFKKLMELKHEDLVKQAEPLAKAKGYEFDPKATKAVLAEFILTESDKK